MNLSNGKIQPAPEPGVTKTNRFVFAPDGQTILTFGYIDSDGLVTPSLSLWDKATWQEAPVASFYAMHDPFGLGGDPVFSQDQTRLVQVQSAGVGFVVWGSRPPGQAEALSTLQDYLGLLAEGKYAEAASQLLLEEIAGLEHDGLGSGLGDHARARSGSNGPRRAARAAVHRSGVPLRAGCAR